MNINELQTIVNDVYHSRQVEPDHTKIVAFDNPVEADAFFMVMQLGPPVNSSMATVVLISKKDNNKKWIIFAFVKQF